MVDKLAAPTQLILQRHNASQQLVDVFVKTWGHGGSPDVPGSARCACAGLASVLVQQTQTLTEPA